MLLKRAVAVRIDGLGVISDPSTKFKTFMKVQLVGELGRWGTDHHEQRR